MVDPNVKHTPMKDIKYCCIPSCKNNTRDTQKLFFTVPNSNKFEWCNAMGITCPKRVIYLCENHINLEEDIENYLYWTLMKGRPKLKPRLPESLKNTKQINKKINKSRASTRSTSMKVDVTKTLPKNPNSVRVRKGRKVKSNTSEGDVRSRKNRRVCMKRAINVKEASEMGKFCTDTMDFEEQKPIIPSKEPNKESKQECITSTVPAELKSKKSDEGCKLEQIMSKNNYHEDKCIKEETEENELGIKKENAEDFSVAEDNTECCSTEDEEEVLTMKCEVFDEPLIPQERKAKTNAQRQKEYRQRKKQEKERLNPKKKPKTKAEHQREYRRRKKLQMESLSPKRKPKTRAECKKQFQLKQKMLLQSEQLDSNVARKREEEVKIKQENTEDCSIAENNAEYPSIEDIEEGKITVKCEIYEEPLHLSGSENDVTSATAQIQVKLEPQDELSVENSLYFEVPPLIRPGSAGNFVTSVQVKVEYEEDDKSPSEPLRMEFP